MLETPGTEIFSILRSGFEMSWQTCAGVPPVGLPDASRLRSALWYWPAAIRMSLAARWSGEGHCDPVRRGDERRVIGLHVRQVFS